MAIAYIPTCGLIFDWLAGSQPFLTPDFRNRRLLCYCLSIEILPLPVMKLSLLLVVASCCALAIAQDSTMVSVFALENHGLCVFSSVLALQLAYLFLLLPPTEPHHGANAITIVSADGNAQLCADSQINGSVLAI
jgi:hypothetical protein